MKNNIITKVLNWAKKEESIRAVILTGSRAQKDQVTDDLSDYDIAVFCTNYEKFLKDNKWLLEIEKVWVSIPEKFYVNDNFFETRLVIFDKGINVDFAFTSIDTLENFTKNKRLPDEYNIGYKVFLDKDGLTCNLSEPLGQGFKISKPTEKEFLDLCKIFWFEVYHIAKYIKREDLWFAKFRDSDLKNRFLIKMIQWNVCAKHDWNLTTHSLGKRMESWIDKKNWNELFKIFAYFDKDDSRKALLEMMTFFRRIARETAKNCGYSYLEDVDKNISDYVLNLLNKK